MREAISQFFSSIIKTLGLFNRVINTADALLETAEDAAIRFRDEEREAADKIKALAV